MFIDKLKCLSTVNQMFFGKFKCLWQIQMSMANSNVNANLNVYGKLKCP